jgi:hypothetical protein
MRPRFLRSLLCLIALPALLSTARSETIAVDVVIYGGTSAGVVAAIQVAKLGKTVALIEEGGHFGGMSVEGLGGSDIDNHKEFKNGVAVGGMAAEFYRRLGAAYGRDGPVYRFEPKVAEKVFAEWLAKHRVALHPRQRLAAVEKDGPRLVRLKMKSGAVFAGKMFLDATYEGDLLALAGVTTRIGRETNAEYGETKSGIRGENSYRQFTVRVDPYRVPGDPRSGVIATIQDEPFGTPGEGDHRLQGFCFRLCLTKNPGNRLPWVKPADYDPANYEIYRRYFAAGGMNDFLDGPGANLPNGKTDLGSWHDLSANLYGMNHGWPAGGEAARTRILGGHLSFTQGLCWFLANDPAVPEKARAAWTQWGPCLDEFTDHGGWPRMFYVRDARRMVSEYVITEHHTKKAGAPAVEDSVGVAYWPPDTHHARRIVKDGAAYNEGFVFGGNDWAPFGVSYRALVPRASEAVNLLTPTCPSSTHVAYGAIRLEWTFMVLGQSAGVAASRAIDDAVPVQRVSYEKLKAQLLAEKQVLAVP